MKKRFIFITAFLAFIIVLAACKKDDSGDNITPPRDRGEEAVRAQAEIEDFLNTHFYNYEEFANPPANFDYKIKFDSLVGDNADKIPLIEQVDFKMVKDRVDDDVTYKLYYLKVIEGEGDPISFPDIAVNSYEGRRVRELTLFDSSTVPVRFDLTSVINGYQDAIVEFKGASEIIENEDGSVSFEGYGVGAVFVPSGLGYFNNPPGIIIGIYDQLIFAFQLYASEEGDQDEDGVPSVIEDVNNNNIEEDDDTDEDGFPNYLDTDDDNDGKPTEDEIEIAADGTITFPDVDGDGTPDYLDSDS